MTARELLEEQIVVGPPAMRDAGADHRGRQLGPGGDPEAAAVVEIGALAPLSGEGLLIGRIEDQPGHELVVALECDRDGEDRDAVQEVGGAVERIDDPAMGAVGAFDLAALLHQEAIARPCAGQLLEENLLGAVVGGADEIGGPLSET